MSTHYDVIIVGSGPAGATAAFHLGQAGKKVLVLEKEKLPRYKTCGGGLSIRFLEKEFPFSFEPVLESSAKALSYAYLGRQINMPIKPGSIGMFMRSTLDAWILEHAHVEVCQGLGLRSLREVEDRVDVETEDGRQFSGSYLVGADGANSTVARRLGLRPARQLAAAIEAEAPVSKEVFRRFSDRPLFIFSEIRYGYLWIFPKADHMSVGIAALHPKRGLLQSTLTKVMARYGISLEGVALHGHPIPIYMRQEQISTRRVLLAGDAAGLVDPLSGEGIRYAIKSGRIAAQAILSDQSEEYAQMIYREIGLNHIFARIVAQLFYGLESVCLYLGAPNPFTTQVIVDLLSDQESTAHVMLYSILTLPVYVFTEIAAVLAGLVGGKDRREKVRAWVYGN